MILIAHRGNINGRFELSENKPNYIDKAILEEYNVEIDVWYKDNSLFLGHDKPEYAVDLQWFRDRASKLWIHCKNIEAVEFFNTLTYNYNYFWHQEDILTLTSHKYIWVYPGNQPIKNSVAVMPELYKDDIENCIGICSDYIQNYKK
jgi:hypothetical protein